MQNYTTEIGGSVMQNYTMEIGGIVLSKIEMPAIDAYRKTPVIIGEHRRDIYGQLRTRIRAVKHKWEMELLWTPNTEYLRNYLDGTEISFIDYDGAHYVVKLIRLDESSWPKNCAGGGQYGLAKLAIELEEV